MLPLFDDVGESLPATQQRVRRLMATSLLMVERPSEGSPTFSLHATTVDFVRLRSGTGDRPQWRVASLPG
jgi:hypothetical protein